MKKSISFEHDRKIFLSLLTGLCLLFASNAKGQVIETYAVFSDSARIAGSLAGNFFISGIDTSTTQEIELRAGDSQNDSLSFVQVIAFDPVSLPVGYSYDRAGSQISVGVSAALPLLTYYCLIRIKSGNTWSAPYRFVTN